MHKFPDRGKTPSILQAIFSSMHLNTPSVSAGKASAPKTAQRDHRRIRLSCLDLSPFLLSGT
jgi:hypothetical protein